MAKVMENLKSKNFGSKKFSGHGEALD